MIIKSYNPANNELMGEIESTPISEIEKIVENTRIAFEYWGRFNVKRKNVIYRKITS